MTNVVWFPYQYRGVGYTIKPRVNAFRWQFSLGHIDPTHSELTNADVFGDAASVRIAVHNCHLRIDGLLEMLGKSYAR